MKSAMILAFLLVTACTEKTTNRPPPSGSGDGDRAFSSCGNERLDGLEPCDGALFRQGSACADYSLGVGNVACVDCTLFFGGCAETDLCTANSWYSDGLCQDCVAMGGTADTECATLCGADGTCADELNDVTGQWTCQASTGGADPDCGTCGNGTVENNERCDGTAFATGLEECTDYDYVDGTLRCGDDCLPDFISCVDHVCGNHVIEAGEECDAVNLAAQSCSRMGYFRGELGCSGACRFDTSGCIAGGSASFDGLVQAMCSFLVRCEATAGRVVAGQRSCNSNFSSGLGCGPLPPASQTQVNACANSFSTLDCSVALYGDDELEQAGFGALSADCFEVFLGIAPSGPGEACVGFCSSGYFCQFSLDEAICPVCVPSVGLNQPCGLVDGRLVACAPEYYCDQDFGVCSQPKADGQPCSDSDECLSGLCQGLECTSPLAEDDVCTANDICAGNYRCIEGQCSDRSLVDGPCQQRDDCVLGATCVEGTCEAEDATCTTGAVGDSCMSTETCVGDTYCDRQQTETCQPLTMIGQLCSAMNQCGGTAYCDQVCLPRAGPGQSCAGNIRCVEGVSCELDVCVAPAANGAECEDAGDCLSDYCDGVSGLCAEPPACVMP